MTKGIDDFTRRARSKRKRTDDQMRLDRSIAARLIHEEGLLPSQLYHRVIVERYDPEKRISRQAFVTYDLGNLRSMWDESARTDMAEVKAETIAGIRHLKSLYYAGYHRSLGRTDPKDPSFGFKETNIQEDDFRIVEIEKAKLTGKAPPSDRKRVRYKREELIGSKDWLDGVKWCIEFELKVRFGIRPGGAYDLARLLPGRVRSEEDEYLPPPGVDDSEYREGVVLPPDKIAAQQVMGLLKEAELIEERALKLEERARQEQQERDDQAIDAEAIDLPAGNNGEPA